MTDEQREHCKEQLTSYVESITERSRGSRNQYNCPLCGSGTGRKRTGAFSIDTQKNRYKCFACDAGGDVFDLIAAVEHLTPNSREVFKRAEELFNVTVTDTAPPPVTAEMKKDNIMEVVQMTDEQIAKNKYIIDKGQSKAFEYDYYTKRGLTAETIEKYKLGIIDNYSFTTKEGKQTQDLGTAAIIPYPNEDYFVARLLDPPGDWSKYVYRAGQPRPRLFNGNALYSEGSNSVIVVEGQIDCLSVLEVGAEAIGLGSATNYRGLLKQLEEKPTTKTLILALDNDETGEKFIAELKKGLEQLNVPYVIGDSIRCEAHDPNEALIKSRKTFEAAIHEAQARASSYTDVKQEVEQLDKEEYIKTNCATTYLKEFINDIKANKGIKGIETGFAGLDDILYGGLYSGLYILGAISSLGKTTFVLQIGDNIAKSGTDVLIFSLEMARKELVSKSLSRLSYELDSDNGLSTRQILNGSFNDKEKDAINAAFKSYRAYSDKLFITEGLGNIQPENIRNTVEKHIKATGSRPVVIIDYLQIISPTEPRATDKQNTDKTVLELKRLSRDFSVPVLAISSLNRDSYGKTISMSAFKESGAIEYSSDILIGLQFAGVENEEKDSVADFINDAKNAETRDIELKILKNRNGITGSKIQLEYNPKYNYFKSGKVEKATKTPSFQPKKKS